MSIPNKFILSQGYASAKQFLPKKAKKSIRIKWAINGDNTTYTKPTSIIANYGYSNERPGLTLVDGTLKLSSSNDSIDVYSRFELWSAGDNLAGQISTSGGILDTSSGNDSIKVLQGSTTWLYGLFISGSIFMGDGDDYLSSNAGISGNIDVYDGLLDMGAGNDTIFTSNDNWNSTGMSIGSKGLVYLGDGDDLITGYRKGYVDYDSNAHLSIFGLLDAGGGNDRIITDSLQVSESGYLLMGSGDDLISARIKGSNGSRIDFGDGQDTLLLGKGDYRVSQADYGWYRVNSSGPLGSYLFAGLELVGGINSTDLVPFQVGNFTIY